MFVVFGAILEAYQALVDIQFNHRVKELLAQGVQMMRKQERTRDQEMKERQRYLPFHMHINLELIERVYVVSVNCEVTVLQYSELNLLRVREKLHN